MINLQSKDTRKQPSSFRKNKNYNNLSSISLFSFIYPYQCERFSCKTFNYFPFVIVIIYSKPPAICLISSHLWFPCVPFYVQSRHSNHRAKGTKQTCQANKTIEMNCYFCDNLLRWILLHTLRADIGHKREFEVKPKSRESRNHELIFLQLYFPLLRNYEAKEQKDINNRGNNKTIQPLKAFGTLLVWVQSRKRSEGDKKHKLIFFQGGK